MCPTFHIQKGIIMKKLTLDAVYDMVDSLSERKRPCDMNDVLNYKIWSEGREDYVRLGDHFIEHLLRKVVKLIEKHHDRISTLEGIIEEKDEFISKLIQEPKGCRYMFCDIPNKQIGKIFVRMLKKYLNKESYKLRVKGQYLDDETKKTEGWKKYEFGQPISKSKCLRVYVDKV